jgi:hypothetical protein
MTQLDIDFARAARDEGIDRAVSHAESEVPRWADVAFEFVKLYAIQHKGQRFIGRQIVLASKEYGLIQPPNDKAFGGPIMRAVREGVIRKVGFTQDPNRHCAAVPEYEA